MNIKIKLMGMLKEKTPAGGNLELADNGSIADALAALDIPDGSVKVFTVNGDVIRDPAHVLAEGDDLVVLPPVGGG